MTCSNSLAIPGKYTAAEGRLVPARGEPHEELLIGHCDKIHCGPAEAAEATGSGLAGGHAGDCIGRIATNRIFRAGGILRGNGAAHLLWVEQIFGRHGFFLAGS